MAKVASEAVVATELDARAAQLLAALRAGDEVEVRRALEASFFQDAERSRMFR